MREFGSDRRAHYCVCVLEVLRWSSLALLPAIVAALLVRFTDRHREPLWLVATTFALGAVFGAAEFFLEGRASAWTHMTIEAQQTGEGPALLFLFALVTPLREAAKVAACWPAFRSKHFDEPYDGVVYASASALGFAALENAILLRGHPEAGALGIARALLSLPAHVFFACMWGYALGRARQTKQPGAGFPFLFTLALGGHGLYIHIVYGRPAGALLATVPLLATMGVVAYFMGRDLDRRGARDSQGRGSIVSFDALTRAPSLTRVREALRRADRPIMIRWILYGTFVTIGAMIVGLAGAIAFGHYAHVDFSIVDEHDVSTTAPVALLGSGLLAAFPASGFLIARASSLPSLLEPALAATLAIILCLVMLGMLAPIALIFAFALAPIAFGLACAGAWVGRP